MKRRGVGTNEPVKIFLRDAYFVMKSIEIRVPIFLFMVDIMMEKEEISFRYILNYWEKLRGKINTSLTFLLCSQRLKLTSY